MKKKDDESNDPIIIQCPGCKAEIAWDLSNPFRPFCSEQCRNKDFVAWADETHVVPGSPTYDDLLSGDLEDISKHSG